MAVESPADIVIVGLNRLSLEAGLYARFLGYRVTLIGNNLSTDPLDGENSSNLEDCTTPLGRKALEAQGSSADEESASLATLEQLDQNYVKPLANSDLLADCFINDCQKVSAKIGESDLPDEPDEDVEYDTRVFEISVEAGGTNREFTADVLIDFRNTEETRIVELSCDFEPQFENQNLDSSERLITNIPDFYCLRSDNLKGDLSFSAGMDNIRDLFKILGDSSSLDLYTS